MIIDAANMGKLDKFFKILPYICFAALAGIMLYHCRFAVSFVDDGLYISMPWRFLKGNRIFVDNWELQQTWGLITAPLLFVYGIINGSYDGVLLYMRVLAVLGQLSVAVLIYRRYKNEYGTYAACVAALLFQSFSNYGTYTLSYNSMGLLFALLTLIFLSGNDKRMLMLSGLFYSLSILSYPMFIITVPYCLFYLLYNKKQSDIIEHTRYSWVYFFIACFACFVLFMIYVFINTGGGIYAYIPYLFETETHLNEARAGVLSSVRSMVNSIRYYIHTPAYLYFWGIGAAVLVRVFRHKTFAIYLKAALLGIMIIHIIWAALGIAPHFGDDRVRVFYAIVPFALNCWAPLLFTALPINGKSKYLLFGLWIPAQIMVIAANFSTNNDFSGAVFPSIIGCIATVFYIRMLIDDIRATPVTENIPGIIKKASIVIGCVFLALYTAAYIQLRTSFHFGNSSRLPMTHQIEKGPFKGIITHQLQYEGNEDFYAVAEHIPADTELILLAGIRPIGYVIYDIEPAAPLTWQGDLNSKQSVSFYNVNTEKRPQVVIMFHKYEWEDVYNYGALADILWEAAINVIELEDVTILILN